MREILFRAKYFNGEWAEGHLIRYEDGRARLLPSHTDIFCYETDDSIIQTVAALIQPETIGQYTGLKDKHGTKIFEGDIVSGLFNHEKISGYIKYGDDATYFVEPHGYGLNNAEIWLEVIGNIYDNPDLLEVKENGEL